MQLTSNWESADNDNLAVWIQKMGFAK